MTLTDRDKADILSLLSSLGDEASNARGAHLAAANPEAAEYLRQVRAISTALQPPKELQLPLRPEQAAVIRNNVLNRGRTRRLGPVGERLVGHLLKRRYSAIAAALLLILGPGLFYYLSNSRGIIAEGILIPTAAHLRAPASSSHFPVLPGAALETGAQLGGVLMRNGNRIAVDRDSTVHIVSKDEIRLAAGTCFIRAVQPIRVSAGAVRFEILQGAVAARASADGISCKVFSGAVTVRVGGKTFDIWSGTSWVWDPVQNTSVEGPLETKPPAMVEEVESVLRQQGS